MASRCSLRLSAAVLATGLLIASNAQALDPARPLAEYRLTTWDREDGLPHSLITDVAQSADGYIWVATWLGVARFNGREFVVYDQQQLPWIRDGSANDIA